MNPDKLIVYQGLILRFPENGQPIESAMAHPGTRTKLIGNNPVSIPFTSLEDAHEFCKETSNKIVWIEDCDNLAHIPNGKRLPWNGSL